MSISVVSPIYGYTGRILVAQLLKRVPGGTRLPEAREMSIVFAG
jgi:hypothetical protein